ncbi:MAG: ComEC/Rec2 family competence protein, partial [Myxococcota bacterium]
AVTATIGCALIAAGRRPRAAGVGAAAALVLGALDPAGVLHPGFLLSIAATAAIVSARSEGGWLRQAFVLSARTMVATAPLVLWWFGRVPLVGLLANVLLVPVASLLLVPGAVLHAFAATVLPPLGACTGPPFALAARAFVTACGVMATVPWGQDLPPPDLVQGLLLATGAALLLVLRPWRLRMAVALIVAMALGGAEMWLRHRERPTGEVRATFLDVGQGDAALVDLPDGRAMLVDAGGAIRGRDPGAHVLAPLLAARRRTHIDVAVVTHADPDHLGGLAAVLDHVSVGRIWANRQAEVEDPDGPATALLDRARARGIPVAYPESLCGHEHRFGEARVEVLAPCPAYDPGHDPNDNSLVLRLSFGRHAFLFAGDLEARGEGRLLGAAPPADLRADVLKVPHHGSTTSSTRAFLEAVRPRVGVVSAGARNQFGHPAPAVVRRYEEHDAFLARTDAMGGVVVTTDGHALRLRTWRGDVWPAQPQPESSSSASAWASAPSGPDRTQSTDTPAKPASRSK